MADARRSGSLRDIVERSLTTFTRFPNADPNDLVAALQREVGVPAGTAWRLFQIVPIAACHVVMHDIGPRFPPEYLAVKPGRRITQAARRAWADEPIYRATVEILEGADQHGLSEEQLLNVVWYSAEMHGLTQRPPEGNDIDALVLSETVLFDFEDDPPLSVRRLTDWLVRVLIPVRGAFRPSRWRKRC